MTKSSVVITVYSRQGSKAMKDYEKGLGRSMTSTKDCCNSGEHYPSELSVYTGSRNDMVYGRNRLYGTLNHQTLGWFDFLRDRCAHKMIQNCTETKNVGDRTHRHCWSVLKLQYGQHNDIHNVSIQHDERVQKATNSSTKSLASFPVS